MLTFLPELHAAVRECRARLGLVFLAQLDFLTDAFVDHELVPRYLRFFRAIGAGLRGLRER